MLVFVFLLTGEVHGQSLRTGDYGRGDLSGIDGYTNQQVGANPFENPEEEGEEQADSVKEKKPRVPLESWYFNDSIRAQRNFAWNVDMFTNNVKMSVIDTTLNDFQVDFPFQKQDVCDAYQGNHGRTRIPFYFYPRPHHPVFYFTRPFSSYLYTSETALYPTYTSLHT